MGLVVPMVNTADDARAVVGNTKYAPRGQRSWGRSRVAAYVAVDDREWAEQLAIIVMIETVEAVRNAEAIMAVEGIVGCLIGPNDLALSMGLDRNEAGPGTRHESAILNVLEACKRTGKAAGTHCVSAYEVTRRIDQGFQFLSLLSDSALLDKAARAEYAAIDLEGTRGSGRAATTASPKIR
jgi:4-hydroxy-2-oxoheptanedioate aldolase